MPNSSAGRIRASQPGLACRMASMAYPLKKISSPNPTDMNMTR